jgi:hypothetical protein
VIRGRNPPLACQVARRRRRSAVAAWTVNGSDSVRGVAVAIIWARKRSQVNDKGSDITIDSAERHEPSEITYDEQFYPARPKKLRPRARLRLRPWRPSPSATANPAATTSVRGLAGRASMLPTRRRSPSCSLARPACTRIRSRTRPPGRHPEGLGLVHGVPDLHDHQGRHLLPRHAR